MSMMWMKRVLMAATLMALAPACGDDAAGDKVTESPNLGEKGSVKATAAAGGELALPESGVTLSIPAGALAEDTDISAEVISKKSLPEAANLAGNVIEFGPDGLTFLKPVGLEIDLAGATIPEGADVSIAWLDEKKNEWVNLSGSKMSGDKLTAETTHFTKFAIRFIINEDGDVVQDGGQCDTSGFKACGGDLEGTWDFTVGCVTLPTREGDNESNPAAKCIAVDISVDFSGTVTFSGGTIKGESVMSVEGKSTINKQCLADAFAAQSMGQKITADQIDCQMFADDPEPGEEPTKVTDTGDMCELDLGAQEPETNTIDGTYTTENNTLTVTDTASEPGQENDKPEAQEYCVEGDTLTLVSRNDDGTVVMLTAKRK